MRVEFKIELYTDGDFSLRSFEEYKMHSDGEDYFGIFVFDDNEKTPLYPYEDHSYANFDALWRARALLKHMLCDIHVLHTHYYLLDDIYHMFNNAITALNNKEPFHQERISGNYDGTEIAFMIKNN